MNKRFLRFLFAAQSIAIILTLLEGCSGPSEPPLAPPQPVFVPNSASSDPVDHGIFADVGGQNAIDIEWQTDTTGGTSGYRLFRSNDSSVGSDGLLVNRIQIADLESSNPVLIPPPTSWIDTLNIAPGGTYYYQLQGLFQASNNSVTYSIPTHPGFATSFHFDARSQPLAPNGSDTLHGFPLSFLWYDPNNGGTFRILVQRLDTRQFVANWSDQVFASTITANYPDTATPLIPGIEYQWRVKWIESHGGSTSPWTAFNIEP